MRKALSFLLLIGIVSAANAHPSVPYIGLRQNTNCVTTLSMNGRVLDSEDALIAPLTKLIALSKDLSVYVLVDTDVPMSEFMKVMQLLQGIGFTSISVFYRNDTPARYESDPAARTGVSFHYIDRERFERWLLSWKDAHKSDGHGQAKTDE